MTNEEFEKELKRIEQVVTELRNKLLESKVDKKPYEVKVPDDIDDYVYIVGSGDIYDADELSNGALEDVYNRGLAFKSKEEAEQFDKERILLFKLHKWAEEHNGEWTPNWNDYNEEKWTVMYYNEHEEFEIYENYRYREFLKLPYFESEEIAELFIKEFGDEIKEVLC
nr:MAG TPA: hypothetical protein [Caudoviricetes sp.]